MIMTIAVVLTSSFTSGQETPHVNSSLLETSFGKLRLYFVENRGVYPDEVKYYIQGADKTLFFTKTGITFRLKGKDRSWVVKVEFVDANPDVSPEGQDKQQAVFSYFKGQEKNWKTGLPTFSKVVYEDLWPGIDLIYKGTVNQLKYEFIVKPGADPAKIRVRYQGVTGLKVTETGSIRVETPVGSFEDDRPKAWQETNREQMPVDLAYKLQDDNTEFGFRVGEYDTSRLLILDPAIVVYCGYIGGSNGQLSKDIAVDVSGSVYVTGLSASDEKTFPVKVGPDLTYNGGLNDVFVAKVNAAGTGLVYCGYIGGADDDFGTGIAVDAGGNAYVTGSTDSDENSFPVKVGPELTHNGGRNDVFVAKVNAQGTGLVYCGYIGGSGDDGGLGIAVDASMNAYLTGSTNSNEKTFPVKVGPDVTYNRSSPLPPPPIFYGDAFVAKVNAQGTALVYCGYIGGSNDAWGDDIAVDTAGNAYVAGLTTSDEKTFPVKAGPDLKHNGKVDAFVTKVNAQGTALVYCGYIGGADDDSGTGIAVDAGGNAYVTGSTTSDEKTFPVKVGPDLTYNGGTWDSFVVKVALLDNLTASGTTRPGGTVTLNLQAIEVRGLPYQLGTSLGTGPISIDTRQLGLHPDMLLWMSLSGLFSGIFQNYAGTISAQGWAKAAINIPNDPKLIGVRLHSAFVTLQPSAPSGIKSISNTFSFSITK